MNIFDIVDFIDDKKSKLNSFDYLELMRLLSILHGSSLIKKKQLVNSCYDEDNEDTEDNEDNSYNNEYIEDYI